MPVRSISYDNKNHVFRVEPEWPVGISEIAVYFRRAGEGPLDDETLDQTLRARKTNNPYGLRLFNVGTGQFNFAVTGQEACWIEIYYCDVARSGGVARHECAGRYFNGSCKVDYSVERIAISDDMEAVRMTVVNRSAFDLEAGSIGYSVGRRTYRIPVPLKRNVQKALAQFEVPEGADVAVAPLENGYPVVAKLIESGRSRRGE